MIRSRVARCVPDTAIESALFLFAVALRIPYLYFIPTWADDVGESVVALQIANGVVSPFAVMALYVGPLHPDLLALVLRFYADPYVPRAMALVLASLTVVATYFLGRSLYNRATGLVAGLFLATSSTHIVVNSHLAYASAATPLFTTLACLFLFAAEKRKNAWLLVLAGVSLACALQTHPVAVAIVPGLLLWFWSRPNARSWLRRPGLYLAGLASVAAYAPVLYPVLSRLGEFQQSIATRSYALETSHSLQIYLGNLQNLLVEVLRMVGAHYANASRPLLYLADPLVLAFALIVLVGVIVSLRGGRTLPLFALGSAALIIPYYTFQYGAFPVFTRYVAFLLPLVYVLAAGAVVDLHDGLSTQSHFKRPGLRRVGQILVGLFVVALILAPAWRTLSYYDQRVKAGATNAPFLEIAGRADAETALPILLDESLRGGEFPGGGNLHRAFRFWFKFRQRPYRQVNAGSSPAGEVCTDAQALLIATPPAAAALAADCATVPLLQYTIPTRPGRGPFEYALYEIGPRN